MYRHQLANHTPHRDAGYVRSPGLQAIEQANRIVRHGLQGV